MEKYRMKMTKAKIYQTLIDHHKDIIDDKAWTIYYRDWGGDMAARESAILEKVHQTIDFKGLACKLFTAKEYYLFLKSLSNVTQTHWFESRRFNYDGTPCLPLSLKESAA